MGDTNEEDDSSGSGNDDEPLRSRVARRNQRPARQASARSTVTATNDDDDDDENEFEFDDSPPKKTTKVITPKATAVKGAAKTKSSKPKATTTQHVPTKKTNDDDDFMDDDASPAPRKKSTQQRQDSDDPKKRKRSNATKTSTTTNKKPKKRAAATTTTPTSNTPDNVKSETIKPTAKQLKALDKTERLQYAMQAFLWWNEPELPAGCQWTRMEHAGVSFPELYQPHHVPLRYNGKDVSLTPVQEEAATFFAATDPDGMHLGNPTTAKIFIQNFFADFITVLGKHHTIKEFSKCDFGPMRAHLAEQKMIKKAVTDAERRAAKDDRSSVLHQFGYALVDGHLERVGNFNMEPPGAFRGRGAHPKMGQLKHRVRPEQVSLNVSQDAPVPKCPVPGHAWGDVRHDPHGQWLATWKENINNQSKYMQLAAQSSFKGKSDRSKYNKAALLCQNISKIRASYKNDLKSKDTVTKQLATAVWVIDRLALRVGGEKDTDEEADTVGCCSLRVEHLHFDPNAHGDGNQEIELEFLGKDSMLYKQTIDFGASLYNNTNDNGGMGGRQVYENFKAFCRHKKPSEQVFTDLNPTLLNNHLKQFMDGLSAKVFRTYNASKTLQDELLTSEASLSRSSWQALSATDKVTEYNTANRQVAILCNHQRSVSKAQETQLESMGTKITTLKQQKKQLKAILKVLNAGDEAKVKKIPLRQSYEAMQSDVDTALEQAKRHKEMATTNAEKIAATHADEQAKAKKRQLADAKFDKAHLWDKIPTSDQVMKKIDAWSKKIDKIEMDLKHKDDNKEVSLGTSKINYMDPRITVAWCKRNEVPVEKVFSKTLRDKFNWAMAVPPNWEFNEHAGTIL